jgi:hypothetical protein
MERFEITEVTGSIVLKAGFGPISGETAPAGNYGAGQVLNLKVTAHQAGIA